MLYEIHIDNNGDGQADLSFQFQFQTKIADPDTFLYNVGPILSLDSPNWNNRQFYQVATVKNGQYKQIATGLACPPCNIGPLSTPHYGNLARQAIHDLPGGIKVFAGQRADGFYVDLGAIFDLGDLRPFETLHAQYGLGAFTKAAPGVNSTAQLNVHSIAIQVPISQLLWGSPHGKESDQGSVIGVWTTASRQSAEVWDAQSSSNVSSGPWRQVSRLGNPLVNEVLIPLGKKDFWNTEAPDGDKQFASYVAHPELAGLLPVLYPGVFPNLEKLVKAGHRAGRPGGDPAHRDPGRDRQGLPELHRPGAGGHAAAQHRDQAEQEAERARHPRRRPGRLPQRAPGVRRRGLDRAPRDRRGDHPAGGPDVQAGRGGRPGHRRPDRQSVPSRYYRFLPVPRHAL